MVEFGLTGSTCVYQFFTPLPLHQKADWICFNKGDSSFIPLVSKKFYLNDNITVEYIRSGSGQVQ